MGFALGISFGLKLYFTVYHSSRHNTDTEYGFVNQFCYCSSGDKEFPRCGMCANCFNALNCLAPHIEWHFLKFVAAANEKFLGSKPFFIFYSACFYLINVTMPLSLFFFSVFLNSNVVNLVMSCSLI